MMGNFPSVFGTVTPCREASTVSRASVGESPMRPTKYLTIFKSPNLVAGVYNVQNSYCESFPDVPSVQGFAYRSWNR